MIFGRLGRTALQNSGEVERYEMRKWLKSDAGRNGTGIARRRVPVMYRLPGNRKAEE
jgi:hypothetical protein